MYWKKISFMGILLASLLVLPVRGFSYELKGDGDVFPHSCVDFSGIWVSKDGEFYYVEQESCKRVRITVGTNKENFLDMFLDNQTRNISCDSGVSVSIRNRWNSLNYGTKIYSITNYTYTDRLIVEQYELELVSSTVLELTRKKSTVFFGSGKIYREYRKFPLYRYFLD